ncbi:DUF2272 domain-containing protein [Flavobacterium sp. MXW15]|uniref:DUF2272 domain-containing protein n=1 Tax=Xanthomonas chitinilytica TaxID=2989819 RepID=A0ABT3JRK4_9XANT|nr:DUF2272 domain-containing protein [Xanthomonas sp. H13-6]MCW4453824.1 DUF2272 domain-containing protein [Flavobacterium sp. MXW15]MCW4471128.1 DUF2272 domain-containing protein [Xanthomonas sp. H13-6]
MRRMPLPACLVLAVAPLSAAAAEVCDLPPRYGLSPTAIAVVRAACNEHRLWHRPFIDRQGRAARLDVTEAESADLADQGLVAWQRVAGYWRESGTLSALDDLPGARSCQAPLGSRYLESDCRAFLLDNPWSAAFVSWVMGRAGVAGFARSPRHIDYIRQAFDSRPGAPYRLDDPATGKPAPGDLLCFLRGGDVPRGHAGLRQALADNRAAHWKTHCEIVVAANVGGDRTLYLIGGNVLNAVTLRMLPLDRSGRLEPPQAPATGEGETAAWQPGCTPAREAECDFNRRDWAALLKLQVLPAPTMSPPPPGTGEGLPPSR